MKFINAVGKFIDSEYSIKIRIKEQECFLQLSKFTLLNLQTSNNGNHHLFEVIHLTERSKILNNILKCWRLILFVRVCGRQPWMLEGLLSIDALLWVLLEHGGYEVASFLAHTLETLLNVEFIVCNCLVNFGLRCTKEWWFARQHHKRNTSSAPNVNFGIVLLMTDDFWWHVNWTSEYLIQLVFFVEICSKPKICEFDIKFIN